MNDLVRTYLLIDEFDGWDQCKNWNNLEIQSWLGLDKDDAAILGLLIQGKTKPGCYTYKLDAKKDGQKYLEMIQEGLHQGLDGWSQRDILVIEAFLSDIAHCLTIE